MRVWGGQAQSGGKVQNKHTVYPNVEAIVVLPTAAYGAEQGSWCRTGKGVCLALFPDEYQVGAYQVGAYWVPP